MLLFQWNIISIDRIPSKHNTTVICTHSWCEEYAFPLARIMVWRVRCSFSKIHVVNAYLHLLAILFCYGTVSTRTNWLTLVQRQHLHFLVNKERIYLPGNVLPSGRYQIACYPPGNVQVGLRQKHALQYKPLSRCTQNSNNQVVILRPP